jgi:hypothetical protein
MMDAGLDLRVWAPSESIKSHTVLEEGLSVRVVSFGRINHRQYVE